MRRHRRAERGPIHNPQFAVGGGYRSRLLKQHLGNSDLSAPDLKELTNVFTAAESRVTALVAEWWRLLQAGNASDQLDHESERCFDKAAAIISRLVELPAANGSDLAAKVLVCVYEHRRGEPIPGTDAYALMSSTAVDAARFADPRLIGIASSALLIELGAM